jgi:hypothetical protein
MFFWRLFYAQILCDEKKLIKIYSYTCFYFNIFEYKIVSFLLKYCVINVHWLKELVKVYR